MPAVTRAIDLLTAVADAPDGLSSGDLTGLVEGSRSGLFALLNTLKDREWLVQDPSGHYRVGPGLRRVAPPRDADDDVMRATLAGVLADRAIDETVALVRPDPAGRVVIASHLPDHAVQCVYRVGQHRRERSADALLEEPDLLDVDGVAHVSQPELVEVAAPICRDGHRPIAAVLVGIPRQRADDDRVREVAAQVRELAVEVSIRLGAPRWQPWGADGSLVGGEPLAHGRPLDDDEVAELLQGRHGAQLACLREDGTPHVVPLWFDWDGSDLWLTASPGASWATYVGEGSRVSLTIEEPWPALRRVFVTGWAEPVPAHVVAAELDGGITGLRRRLARRHLGAEATRAIPADAGGWTAIRLHPDRVHGRAGLEEVPA